MTRDQADLIRELTSREATGGPGHTEDAGLTAAEAEAVLNRLAGHLVPQPTTAETAALINRLRPLLPRPAARRFRTSGLSREPLAHFLRTQLHHFRPLWWLASLGFVLLGLGAGSFLADWGLSPAVLAPPLIIGGVLYSFHSLRGAALELELSCPVTPAQVALGRILVPLLYCLVLGALPVLAGTITSGPAVLVAPAPAFLPSAILAVRLFLGWAAALFLFAGLMLTLTLHFGTYTAAGLSTALWAGLAGLHRLPLSPFSLSHGALWTPLQVGGLTAGLLLLCAALRGDRLRRWVERRGR